MPRVLFVGDIVGKPGRKFVQHCIPELRKELNVDLVIVNGENAAAGSGITTAIVNDLTKDDIADGITLGDHAFDQREFVNEINNLEKVCRPANFPNVCPGKDYITVESDGYRVGAFTVLGRTFMNKKADCPFRAVDRMIERIHPEVDSIIVEVHAETTSEKVALGWYLDGRVAMVVGTHTHIPTADATILPGKTAYLTDAGMTGPHDSVLGVEKNIIIEQFLNSMPKRYEIAKHDTRLNGCIVDIDPETHLARDFETVSIDSEEY